ncbi:MATE family efflux transporter [Planctomycetota bacterium]
MTDKTTLLSSQTEDVTSLGYMLRLSAPMIVTNISFTIMQFVDRFMVSRLGTEALAAILPAGILSFVPASFAIGLMTSVNTFVSQSLGRGNKKDCSNYCWQVIYMGLAYFSVTFLILWPNAGFIFRMLGHERAIVAMEVVYLRIMLYAQFLAVFIWASSQFFMGIHRPIITMYAAIVSQAVNIGANYILIFGKFGFPAMGIAGAGWGTFIGIAMGASIRMFMFLNGEVNATYKCRQSLNIDFKKMADLVKVGFPAGFGFMVNVAVMGMILFGLVSRFGNESLAATSAVFSCINVSVMPVVGIGTALTAAVGKSIGMGRKDLAAKQASLCLKIALVYMGLIGICFFVFRNSIMGFWSGDAKVIEAGVNILICAAIFQVFDATAITYSGALRGAGDTVWLAIISSVSSVFILGVGGIILVTYFPQLGSLGPWVALTVNIVAIGLANRWRFKSNRWMEIDLFKRRGAPVPVEVEAVTE